MNPFKLTIFLFITLMYGCDSNNTPKKVLNEAHSHYLSSFGWEIDSKLSERFETIRYSPELIDNLKTAGIDFSPHQGKRAVITTYLLKEQQTTGDKLRITVVEVNDKIIGGYGSLENWEPGLFSLNDKDRLVSEGIIR